MNKKLKITLIVLLGVLFLSCATLTTLFVIKSVNNNLPNSSEAQDSSSISSSQNSSIDSSLQNSSSDFLSPDIESSGQNNSSSPELPQLQIIMGITFESANFYYDGTKKQIVVSGNLPNGVTVSYENNSATEVGTYFATAVLYGEGYETLTLSATLTIIACQDMTNLLFNSAEYYYDGLPHYLELLGAPDGATVVCQNNGQVEVGEYKVIATVSCYGYNQAQLVATLTIKELNEITGVTFESKQFYYDGLSKEIAVEGEIPEGVTLIYVGERIQTEVGVYQVKAILSGYGYKTKELVATLTIKELKNFENLQFLDVEYVYDGSQKSVTVLGNLPLNVQASVVYTNNVGVNAGEYNASVQISAEGYKTLTLHATMVIRKAEITGVSFGDASFTFDGSEKTILVKGKIPSGVDVVYQNNRATNAGEYNAVALLTGENYITKTLYASLIIKRAQIIGISFNDSKVLYDGNLHDLTISGVLPNGVSVSYVCNGKPFSGAIGVGEYQITATVSGNNYISQTFVATLTIIPSNSGVCDCVSIGDVIYFNCYDVQNYGLLKYNLLSCQTSVISKSPASCLATDGNKLYYCCDNKIYAKSASTSSVLCEINAKKMVYYNSCLYILQNGGNAQSGGIYKLQLSTRGFPLTKIVEGNASDIAVGGGYLYYVNGLDEQRLYKLPLDLLGENASVLTTYSVNGLTCYENRLYFIKGQSMGSIYKYDSQSGKIGLVCEGKYANVSRLGDYLYFINKQEITLDGAGESICSFNLSSNELRKLIDYNEGYDKLFAINDSLYYYKKNSAHLFRYLLSSGEERDLATYKPSELIGGAYVASSGDDLYFSSLKNGGKLYKYSKTGECSEYISKRVYGVYCNNQILYYTAKDFNGYYLASIDLKTNKQLALIYGQYQDLTFYQNRIYAVKITDDGHQLTEFNSDLSDKYEIGAPFTNASISSLCISNGLLYFINTDALNKSVLYVYDFDLFLTTGISCERLTSNQTKVYVYSRGKISSLNLNSLTTSNLLSNVHADELYCFNNYLCFSGSYNEQKGLYLYNTESGEIKLISQNCASGIIMLGDYLYFTDAKITTDKNYQVTIDETESSGNLYRYNIKTGESSIIA